MKSLKPMFRGNITKDLRNGSHVIIKKGYVRVVGVGEGSKNQKESGDPTSTY